MSWWPMLPVLHDLCWVYFMTHAACTLWPADRRSAWPACPRWSSSSRCCWSPGWGGCSWCRAPAWRPLSGPVETFNSFQFNLFIYFIQYRARNVITVLCYLLLRMTFFIKSQFFFALYIVFMIQLRKTNKLAAENVRQICNLTHFCLALVNVLPIRTLKATLSQCP